MCRDVCVRARALGEQLSRPRVRALSWSYLQKMIILGVEIEKKGQKTLVHHHQVQLRLRNGWLHAPRRGEKRLRQTVGLLQQ